jgi:hypothetical protein
MLDEIKLDIKRIQNHHFYNIKLREDTEKGTIDNCIVVKSGYIGNRPKNCRDEFHEDNTWALDVYTEDNFILTCYLYTSEFEYNKDVEKLES